MRLFPYFHHMEPGYYKGSMDYGEPIFRFQKSERPFSLTVVQDRSGGLGGKIWFEEDEEEFDDEFKIPYNGMGVTISCSDKILVMLDSSAVLRVLAEKLGEGEYPRHTLSVEFVAFEKEDERSKEKYYEGDWKIKEFVKLLGFIPWIKKHKKGTWKLSRMEDVV